MIESVMYIGIGFLIAGLLVIGFIPLVHGRAVRLTTRRLDALNPVSMTEIQAQKDQLRAQFAMSTHRLEMKVEQLKTRSGIHLAELDKKNSTISRVKFELGEKADNSPKSLRLPPPIRFQRQERGAQPKLVHWKRRSTPLLRRKPGSPSLPPITMAVSLPRKINSSRPSARRSDRSRNRSKPTESKRKSCAIG
jgi:hypothetical protein